jgi:hypothetical protein
MKNYEVLSNDEKKDFWLQHIKKWEDSGLSQRKYCEKNRINHNAFAWRRNSFKDKKNGKGLIKIASGIVRDAIAVDNRLELIINKTVSLKIGSGFDPDILRQILEALAVKV